MSFTQRDKKIIRELAQKYSEIANRDEQKNRRQRMLDTNNLKLVRPTVLFDELPWHEMDFDGSLTCQCEDEFAREMEVYFRRNLFKDKYFLCDTIFENFYPIKKIVNSTETGLIISDDILSKDDGNNIVSHIYKDTLPDEEALNKIKMPVFSRGYDEEQRNMAKAQELLGGTIQAVLVGKSIYYAPWDFIPRYRGVDTVFIEMYDRPEFLHKIIQKLTDIEEAKLESFERLGVLDPYLPTIHCTPSYIDGVPSKTNPPDGKYKLKDMWFRSMAQMFSSVSPQMHYEFDLKYSIPLMEKCAYTYYGCCESLDNKMEMLEKIPNLRKVGVSPWVDVDKMAEQLGGKYVYARKPNPANVAIETSEAVVRKETAQVAQACIRNGCPCEFVLKDISTVNRNPKNLIVWAQTVCCTLDEYYGER